MLKCIVCPFLLLSGDFYFADVADFRSGYSCPVPVVVKQCVCGLEIFAFVVQGPDVFQSGIIQVQKFECFRPQCLCARCDNACGKQCRCYDHTFHLVVLMWLPMPFKALCMKCHSGSYIFSGLQDNNNLRN